MQMCRFIQVCTFAVTLFLTGVIIFPVSAHSKDIKKVVFIRYRIEPNYFSTVLSGFKEEMAQRGYVEGRNIRYIDVLTDTADRRSVPQVLQAVNLHKDTTDLFVTCGWVSLFARESLKGTGIPQLFVPVLKSVALKMVKDVKAIPGTNVSGIYLMYPPEKVLRISRLLLPGATRYAYVFDSRIPADMVFKDAYESLEKTKRHGFHIYFLDLSRGIQHVSTMLKKNNIEVFGGIVGAFKHRTELCESNIPMVTSFTLDVEKEDIPHYVKDSTILAGLFNPFSYCGKRSADMAADMFDGKKTIENTLPGPARQMAFINLRAAERLGVYVPFRAIEAVDMVIK